MLKRLGHNVRILEQHPSSTRNSQAAGISMHPAATAFVKKHDLAEGPNSIAADGIQYLDSNLQITGFRKLPMKMTSWDMLYYRMRANFDGLQSAFCPKPPQPASADGDAIYDLGKRVIDLNYEQGKLCLQFEDVATHGSGLVLQPDLVIAADGGNSWIRQRLCPEVRRPYAGYVAWRGTVAEKDVSEETRELFFNRTTHTVLDRSYVIL